MKLDEIRKLLETSTPGPWASDKDGTLYKPGSRSIMDVQTGRYRHLPVVERPVEDAQLIVAMRSMAPKMLAVCEASHWLLGALSRADDQHEIASHEQTLREALAALEAPNG